MKGLVTKKNAGQFIVDGQSCVARGNLKDEGIFVGDIVEYDKSQHIIEKVLSDISYADREKINEAIQKAADKLCDYIVGKLTFDALMQEINKG